VYKIKNSNDEIGNQTRDLSTSSTTQQKQRIQNLNFGPTGE